MTTNLIGVALGAAGILTPFMGGLLHILHTGGIFLNSSLLLNWKPKD
jgi:cation-transporting P-type ATPase C